MADEALAMDIEEYKLLVDRCARERLNRIIPNGSPIHARILIAKLFETARHTAVLVSGQLMDTTKDGDEVYGYKDVITAAVQFLRRQGSKCQIILEEPIDMGVRNRFLRATINDNDRKGEIVIYPKTEAVTVTSTPHLMVNDALAYRLELDNKKIEAFANFGDERYAASVVQLFQKLESYVQQLGKRRLSFLPGQQFALA